MHIIRAKTISGVKWTYLSNFLARGIQPLTVAVLARFLTPEDFGLVAMALTVTGFIRLFKDLGLGQALIQYRGRTKEAADVIFWLQLIFGIIWLFSIWVTAPIVAGYYHHQEVVPVLRTLGLLFVIYPFSDVPLNLLIRELEFKALFMRQVAPLLGSAAVSIILAYLGFGVWALVFGTLAGATAIVIVVWHVTNWRPGFRHSRQLLTETLRFGTHVSVQKVLGWAISSVDRVFVGRFLGAEILGFYQVGFTIGEMPWSFLAGPLNSVLFPVFCKAQSDLEMVKRRYLSFLRWISLVSIPVGILVVFLAPSLIPFLLGAKWEKAILIVQLVAITGINSSIVMMNPEVHKAIGRPDIMSKFYLARSIVSLPIYYYASQKSIETLALAHVGLALLFGPVNMFICMRILRVKAAELLYHMRSGIAVGVTFIIVGIFYRLTVGGAVTELVNGVGLLVTFAAGSVIALWLSDQEAVWQLIRLLKPRKQIGIGEHQ